MVWRRAHRHRDPRPHRGQQHTAPSAREVKDFILSDLDRAATMLASKTMNGGWSGSDYGRVTSGTAVALKGRGAAAVGQPALQPRQRPEPLD